MALTQFDPPGFLSDFDDSQRQAWSEWISQQLDAAHDEDGTDLGLMHDGPRLQFFNPLRTPPGPDATEQDITWTAFPRIVKLQSGSDLLRWRKADSSRDMQDEYCEWSVSRDHNDNIVRVTFTSEGPEYWKVLAGVNPAKVVALYQAHVDPAVKHEDLFANGTYNPRNRWNNSSVNGAMHLIQANNTLGAEIELAAAATIVRERNGAIIT
ncbi:MAG: hypothetical protein WB992_12475, partial [Bryobacteraceae bacterium]